MRQLITFSGAAYDAITGKTVVHTPDVKVYDDLWFLAHDFWKVLGNQWLKEHHQKRGLFWYTWKSLCIIDALSRCQDGDIVLYVDGDTYPVADLSPVYEIAEREDFCLFAASSWSNRPWCKRDCYIVMGQENPIYRDAQAGCARFMAFKKGPWAVQQFLAEWLTYCVNPLATTFDPSVLLPENDGFREHRTEQAIMTLLALRYGIYLHREACQAGNSFIRPEDGYGQLFEQVDIEDSNPLHVTHEVKGSRWRNV